MRKQFFLLSLLGLLLLNLSGCAVVGGIFKAGMIWGIMLVVLLIIGIIYLVSKSRRK